MKDLDIHSLHQLRKRKRAVRREMREFEYDFEDAVYNFTHPFSKSHMTEMFRSDLECSYNKGIYKFIVNSRRLVEIMKLGNNIFKDFRR